MKTVTVIIDENGETSVDLAGFHGKGCDKVMDDFAAGEKPTILRTKPEYRETAREKQSQRG